MTKRRVLAALTVVGIVLAIWTPGCGQSSPTVSQDASPTLWQPGVVTPSVVSAEAVIVPYKEADLSFTVAGRLLEMLVTEGEAVSQGQELAELETQDLQLMVRSAEAGLASAKAQLERARAGARSEEIALSEADVAIAEGNVAVAEASLVSIRASLDKVLAGPSDRDIQIAEKQVELAKNQLWAAQAQRDAIGGQLNAGVPGVTPYDHEAAKGQVAVAETQVAVAQLQLEQLKAGARSEDIAAARAQVTQGSASVQTAKAQLQLAQAQLALAKAGARQEDIAVAEAAVTVADVSLDEAQLALANAVLRAPFDGIVGTILYDEGEWVTPQLPVIQLGDITKLRARTLDLSEADVNRLELGQEASVTVDALAGTVFKATVAQIAPVATERRGETVFAVTLDLEVGSEVGLRWGMSAWIEIEPQ